MGAWNPESTAWNPNPRLSWITLHGVAQALAGCLGLQNSVFIDWSYGWTLPFNQVPLQVAWLLVCLFIFWRRTLLPFIKIWNACSNRLLNISDPVFYIGVIFHWEHLITLFGSLTFHLVCQDGAIILAENLFGITPRVSCPNSRSLREKEATSSGHVSHWQWIEK